MNLDEAIQQLEETVAQVRQTSLADDKTPLGNSLSLRKESDKIKQGQSEYDVVIFGDLNDFKTLNDTHGHEAGDSAIEKIGEKIYRDFVEKLGAKAFRQSGDEFVIFLKSNSIKPFQAKAASFKSVKLKFKEKNLTVKMSFGLAVSDGKTIFGNLLERAETACLTAKNRGDGICVQWDEEIQRNALVAKRQNCRKCGSVNKCYIPKKYSPDKLKVCAYCGEDLI